MSLRLHSVAGASRRRFVACGVAAVAVSAGLAVLSSPAAAFPLDGAPSRASLATASALAPAPHVSIASGRVVSGSLSFEVSASEPASSVAISTGGERPVRTIELSDETTWSVVVDSIDLPYGPLWLTVRTRDASGTSAPCRVRLYNVGTVADIPVSGRRVLVDKRAMRAYHVLNRRVLRSWPVATGMPSAPTPKGLFRLGAPQPSGGPWGVLRRPLQRRSGSRWVRTSYYIHGTNEPWSIGMMASHGCVRMFNSHVREFARTVPTGVLVRIR